MVGLVVVRDREVMAGTDGIRAVGIAADVDDAGEIGHVHVLAALSGVRHAGRARGGRHRVVANLLFLVCHVEVGRVVLAVPALAIGGVGRVGPASHAYDVTAVHAGQHHEISDAVVDAGLLVGQPFGARHVLSGDA